MSFNKGHWFFPLLALGEFVVIIFLLVPADCDRETTEKETARAKETHRLPKNGSAVEPSCQGDECQSDQDEPAVDDDKTDDEVDDKGTDDTAKSCSTAEDCGCGYGCTENKCHKLTSVCCVEADCGAGLVCIKKDDQLNGECMISQCETDEQCGGRCGVHCENHRCTQSYCCADSHCATGRFCNLENGQTEGVCLTSQCASNADCGCGKFCSEHQCRESWQGTDDTPPYQCCGTDFLHHGMCVSHEYIENGRCLENAHCPAGQTCDGNKCFPATCANNANCGCEGVCRKNRCERGCDEDSDCCNRGEICDHSRCFNPNEEN